MVGYEEFQQKARKMLNENGCDENEIGMLDRLKTYLMINAQTMMVLGRGSYCKNVDHRQ